MGSSGRHFGPSSSSQPEPGFNIPAPVARERIEQLQQAQQIGGHQHNSTRARKGVRDDLDFEPIVLLNPLPDTDKDPIQELQAKILAEISQEFPAKSHRGSKSDVNRSSSEPPNLSTQARQKTEEENLRAATLGFQQASASGNSQNTCSQPRDASKSNLENYPEELSQNEVQLEPIKSQKKSGARSAFGFGIQRPFPDGRPCLGVAGPWGAPLPDR